MRRLSRLLGLLLSLVFLQLQLVESGYVCAQAADARVGASAMAGMVMGEAAMAAPPDAHATPAHATAVRHDGGPVPSQFPWAPGGCQAAAPCAPAALPAPPAEAALPSTPVLMRVDTPRFAAAAPTGPSLPPELPPPRA